MRFYDLDGGQITLDGRNIASIPRQELRSNIGMVLQDTWLFGGTIRENLAYGNPEATEEQIIEAAEVTYVDRFVRALPDGYDTIINDEGDNVSTGEKQLMTIARAFLADPSILILDEATSSVDTRTEVLIQEAMNALRANRTSFVIAHRLSTIRGADVILVMEHGRIVEQGSHDSLLAANGSYAALYQAQFAGAAAPSAESPSSVGALPVPASPVPFCVSNSPQCSFCAPKFPPAETLAHRTDRAGTLTHRRLRRLRRIPDWVEIFEQDRMGRCDLGVERHVLRALPDPGTTATVEPSRPTASMRTEIATRIVRDAPNETDLGHLR